MENCLYNGKMICTFDLKDENGLYYEDLVLEWKQAAADRHLTCTDCTAHVYLAAGPIKEPYFAHYDLEDCEYGSGHESEELKKGKRLLYYLLKSSFPDSQIQARFRMENGLFSTLYCENRGERPIAVDFRLLNNSLDKFRQRDSFYQGNQILPIYVMGIRQDKAVKQIDWYQNLIQASMGYLAFLDTDHEQMVLKKSYGYRLGNTRKYAICQKTYPIKELNLSYDGQMLCDFSDECRKIEQKIFEEKEQYQEERNAVMKLKEQKLKLEELENERLENYRRLKEQENERLENYRKLMDQESAENTKTKTNKPGILQENGLDPVILEKCRKMIEEGDGHLVSRKYYEAIIGKQ